MAGGTIRLKSEAYFQKYDASVLRIAFSFAAHKAVNKSGRKLYYGQLDAFPCCKN